MNFRFVSLILVVFLAFAESNPFSPCDVCKDVERTIINKRNRDFSNYSDGQFQDDVEDGCHNAFSWIIRWIGKPICKANFNKYSREVIRCFKEFSVNSKGYALEDLCCCDACTNCENYGLSYGY